MKATYWQKYSTITASVPTELKVDLIERSKMLGISLNELMNKILFEEDCKIFDEQVQQLKAENEALQQRILELEQQQTPEPDQDEEQEAYKEKITELENENERLKEIISNVGYVYCELKRIFFKNFVELAIYKEADRVLPDNLRQEKESLLEMKNKGVEALADWYIKQTKNPEKIDKNKVIEAINAEFNKACQLNELFKITPIDDEDRKYYFKDVKEDVKKDFENILDEIEVYLGENEKEALQDCEIDLPEYEDLEDDFMQDLDKGLQLQDLFNRTFEEEQAQKALPKPEEVEKPASKVQLKDDYKPRSKDESILHELYKKGNFYITKYELKALGFDTGFFSNLTVRGGIFGKYQLTKAPSEKVYRLELNPKHKGNAPKIAK